MIDLENALRLTEVLLAVAILQQSAEHIAGSRAERVLFAPRAALSLALLAGVLTPAVLLALVVHSVVLLHWFNGPYNGGSDKMGTLVLICLCGATLLPQGAMQQAVFGYLGVQLVLSYLVSGWVKIVHADWRDGSALRDVFDFSAYPVSRDLRGLAQRPKLMLGLSWAVIGFELAFPLCLLSTPLLAGMMVLAVLFHLANSMFFGLNRFVWAWIAAFPALIWLQGDVLQQL